MHGTSVKHSARSNGTENFPDLQKPLRIELPSYFNTPRRFDIPDPTTEATDLPNINPVYHNIMEAEEKIRVQKRLKDYKLIAVACKRGKKPKVTLSNNKVYNRTKEEHIIAWECFSIILAFY